MKGTKADLPRAGTIEARVEDLKASMRKRISANGKLHTAQQEAQEAKLGVLLAEDEVKIAVLKMVLDNVDRRRFFYLDLLNMNWKALFALTGVEKPTWDKLD